MFELCVSELCISKMPVYKQESHLFSHLQGEGALLFESFVRLFKLIRSCPRQPAKTALPLGQLEPEEGASSAPVAASDCLTTGSVRTDLRGGDAQGKCLSVPSSSLSFTVTLHPVSRSFLPQSALPSHNAGIVHFKGCSSGYEVIPSLRGARDVSNPRRAEPGAAGGGYAGKNLSGPHSKIKRGQNTTNF